MAEAVLKVDGISQGPNASCSCPFCVKFKERESEFDEKIHSMEEIVQEVLRKRLPKKVPITALRLTVELLDGYFQQESACPGFEYTTCRVIDAIKKKVNQTFPMASDVFERNLQTWLQVRKLSKSTGAEDKFCSFCMMHRNIVLERQGVEEVVDDEMALNLKKHFPEKPNSYKEMVELFLNDYYTLNHCPLYMKSNCFGAKFKDCLVLWYISEIGLEIIEDDVITEEKTNQFAQDWFHEQREAFENLKSVTIISMEFECTHTPNVIEIMFQKEWIGAATVMINGILDIIFEKYFVGFALACGSSMNIPISLRRIIFDIVREKHPKLQEASYEECITKWFASRV